MTHKKQAVSALLSLLEKGDEADRCYAARTLGSLGDPTAVGALMARLRDEDIDVCVDAADALGRIGDRRAVPDLLESLEHDPSGEVRSRVIEALGTIGDPRAVPDLLQVIENRPENLEWLSEWDEWWDMQKSAVEAMGRMRVPEAVPVMQRAMEAEEAQDIENEILAAMATIGGEGLDYLRARLKDAQPLNRRRALQALGKADDASVIKDIGRALLDASPDVRVTAIETLTDKQAHAYLSAILMLIRDEHAEVRSAVVTALPDFGVASDGLDELLQDLQALLDDPSEDVQAAAVRCITQVAPQARIDEVLSDRLPAMLDSASEALNIAAADAASNYGLTDAVPQLLQVVLDENKRPAARRHAVLALSSLDHGDDAVRDALLHALADKEESVRQGALFAIMQQERRLEGETPTEQRPIELVIDALKGSIELPARPTNEGAPVVTLELPQQTTATLPGGGDDAADTVEEETAEALPDGDEVAAEAGDGDEALPLADLPESPDVEGEFDQPVMSTLEAITRDGVEAALMPQVEETPPEFDEETMEFLDIVDENIKQAEEMLPSMHVNLAGDLRHLSARILADSDRAEAIQALIDALNDDDTALRCEAADAIARIAERSPYLPELMNASGTLMSQLTLGETYMRASCARALGGLGNRVATTQLLGALEDAESLVRINAVDALARLAECGRDPDPSDHMISELVAPREQLQALIACLGDASSGVRMHAASALGAVLKGIDEQQQGDAVDDCVHALLKAAFADDGHQARTMGQAIRRLASDRAVAQLLAMLDELPTSFERRFVMEMLEEIYSPAERVA